MSTRPVAPVEQLDPLSDIIDTLRLSTHMYGHFEQNAPFALLFEPHLEVDVSLMAILRGTAVVATKGARPATVSAGDLVLKSGPQALELRDSADSREPLRRISDCPTLARAPQRCVRDAARSQTSRAELSFVVIGFRMWLQSRAALLAQLPPLLVVAPDASPTLASLAGIFRAEATSPQGGSRALLSRLSEAVFIGVLRSQGERDGGRCGDLKALADPALARALAQVHARLATEWTIESLGRAAGLSRSAFAVRFHDKVGEPPLRYVARLRMNRAAQLLTESDLGLGDIALQVGYRSEASFHRAFVRFIGVAPGLFRREQRKT